MSDRSVAELGVAQWAGEFQQEGTAFDQTDREAILDDRDHQGVRFAFETCEHVHAGCLGRHRLGAHRQDFYGRHDRPQLHKNSRTIDHKRFQKG